MGPGSNAGSLCQPVCAGSSDYCCFLSEPQFPAPKNGDDPLSPSEGDAWSMGCAPHLSMAVVRKAVSQRGRAFSTWGCHRLRLEFQGSPPCSKPQFISK